MPEALVRVADGELDDQTRGDVVTHVMGLDPHDRSRNHRLSVTRDLERETGLEPATFSLEG